MLVCFLQLAAGQALLGAAFDFQQLREEARQLASQPFQASTNRAPRALLALNYTEYQAIAFKKEKALWADLSLPFNVEFFLPGSPQPQTVLIHEVSEGGVRRIPFTPEAFSFTNRLELPPALDYAGFRITAPGQAFGEVAVFLGASYFRMLGRGQSFGASARGLALNTVQLGKEEFPAFRQFWLRRPGPRDTNVTVWALLDSPSVSGGYEFVIAPGTATVATTKAVLFPRQAIKEFGVAPITSMFWFDENNHPPYGDYRPEVHDSDGLLLKTSAGQTHWRPLDNASMMRVNAYQDRDPQGYGFMQRDRDFEHYQDLVARFELRPSVWVEPVGKWGPGAVELIQLPTNQEYTDNVVAFWRPAKALEPGQPLEIAYKVHWLTNDLAPPTLGQVRATRIGKVPSSAQNQRPNLRFVIDFDGPALQALSAREQIDAEIHCGPGAQLVADTVLRNPLNGTWRLVIEILGPEKAVDIKAVLKRQGQPVTETWTYTWQP